MENKKRQIIAIGGGGFNKNGKSLSDNISLEQYILNQTNNKNPKICFIPTASGESQAYIVNFYQEFSKLTCKPSHLSLFKPPTADLASFILEHDAIFVGGGNTKSMLALWKEWGIDQYLRKAWEHGIVLAGVSAGSICWFEQGITDSIPGNLTVINALGFLEGSNCPHYDEEKERKPAYHRFMREDKISAGIAIDDNVAVHFVNNKIFKIIKSNPHAHAYHVVKEDGIIQEKQLNEV